MKIDIDYQVFRSGDLTNLQDLSNLNSFNLLIVNNLKKTEPLIRIKNENLKFIAMSKKAFSVVLEDIFTTFFPQDFGKKASDWLNKQIIAIEAIDEKIGGFVDIEKEAQKNYNTEESGNGYIFTLVKSPKPIELGDIAVDVFNLSITLNEPEKPEDGLFSIFLSDTPGASYIALHNITVKLGFNKEDITIPIVGGIGAYSVVYSGRLEYYDDFRFKLIDSEGVLLNGSARSLQSPRNQNNGLSTINTKNKSSTRTTSRSAGVKKPYETILEDIAKNFFGLQGDVDNKKILNSVLKWLNFEEPNLSNIVIKLIKLIEDNRSQIEGYYETRDDNGKYLLTIPSLTDAISVINGNVQLIFDKLQPDPDGLGLFSICIGPSRKESFLDIHNINIELALHHNDIFKSQITGVTTFTNQGRLKYYGQPKVKIEGTTEFLIKDTVIDEEHFKLEITTLNLGKGDKPNTIEGKLIGSLVLKGFDNADKVIVLSDAKVILTDEATLNKISISIDGLSLNDGGKEFKFENASFNLKKTKVGGKITDKEIYVEFTKTISEVLPTLPEGIDENKINKLNTTFKYSWKSDSKRSLEAVLTVNGVNDEKLLSQDWDLIGRYFSINKHNIHLFYYNVWDKGNFKFADGLLNLCIYATATLPSLGDPQNSELDLTFILNKNFNNENHFSYKGKMKETGKIVINKNDFELTINTLFFDGEIDGNGRRKYMVLNGVVDGNLKIKGSNKISEIILNNAKIKIKESANDTLLSIEVDKLEFVKEDLDLETAKIKLSKAIFFSKKYKTPTQKEDEAYIELILDFDKQTAIPAMPVGLEGESFHLNGKFKYSWGGADKSLAGSLVLQNNKETLLSNHWDFIPEESRPKIESIALSYQHSWTGNTPFEFKDGTFSVGANLSIQSIIDQIPLKDSIQLYTGNENGYISANLLNNNGNPPVIEIKDIAELGIYIPGFDSEEPAFFTDIKSVKIEEEWGAKKLEIKGEIEVSLANFKIEENQEAEDKNFIKAKFDIDRVPFTFGIIKSSNQATAKVYFTLELLPPESKEFFSVLPGAMDSFTDKVLGNQTIEIENVQDKYEENLPKIEEDKALLKKVILKDKKIGKLTIDLLKLEVPDVKELMEAGAFSLEALADISADFGPFYTKISGLGAKAVLKKSQTKGWADRKNLAIGLTIEPVPPTKAVFNIEAKMVSGGGFLEFDHENHRYAGILALNFKAIDLVAVGLINTKLPNNQPGFSMLICLSVLFKPAIELGLGFKLEGVGGLLGVNRTFNVEAMRSRLASGSINSIMFPEDPIKNAESIISDLREVFPPLENHYVVAPFLRLGWGKVIHLDLGVLLELPFNDRIIILGSIGIKLPEENPRLVVNIDVLGDLNFAEKYIRVEGVLRDSSINNSIPITGGFAFYMSWGNVPQFLFSVGGYHPRYKKPDMFPSVSRVGSVVNYGEALTLTIEFYTAITSNSFQIGFSADFYAKAGDVSMTGYLGFDVLIYFNPFRFEADITMGVDVKYKDFNLAGASLEFRLSGPGPWNAVGKAEFDFTVFTIEVDFNHTWGGSQVGGAPPTITVEELLDEVVASLKEAHNWLSKVPMTVSNIETFKTAEDTHDLLLHPCGYLEVKQQVVPLGRSIEKHGNSYVKNKPSISISIPDAKNLTPLKDHFSRGQFEDMTDEERISSPDFELMNAGYQFGLDSDDAFDIPVSEKFFIDVDIYETNVIEMAGGRGIKGPKEVGAVLFNRGKQPKKQEWKNSRGLLNKSRRQKGWSEKPRLLDTSHKKLIFPEPEVYLVASHTPSGIQSTSVEFFSYSEAKAYIGKFLGIKDKAEIVTLETTKIRSTISNPNLQSHGRKN